MTTFPVFKTLRLAELIQEPWGNIRIPDLQETLGYCSPHRVLEIGCFRGVSTEFWLLHCSHVTAVDPWPDGRVYRDFRHRCRHYPHLDILRGESPYMVELHGKGFTAGDAYDMVYIDGDHSYEAVKKDIIASVPLMTPHGFIAGHDYHGDLQDEVAGVAMAVDELIGKPTFYGSDGSWAMRLNRDQTLKDFKSRGLLP